MGISDLLCISGNILIVPSAVWEGHGRNQQDWKSLDPAREEGQRKQVKREALRRGKANEECAP